MSASVIASQKGSSGAKKKEGFNRHARRSYAPNMGALYKIGDAKLKRIIKYIKEGNYLNKIWSWEDLRLKYYLEVKDKETVKNAFNKRKYFKYKACQRTYIRENNNNNSLLNVRFRSLLGPRGLLLMYMWGENSI